LDESPYRRGDGHRHRAAPHGPQRCDDGEGVRSWRDRGGDRESEGQAGVRGAGLENACDARVGECDAGGLEQPGPRDGGRYLHALGHRHRCDAGDGGGPEHTKRLRATGGASGRRDGHRSSGGTCWNRDRQTIRRGRGDGRGDPVKLDRVIGGCGVKPIALDHDRRYGCPFARRSEINPNAGSWRGKAIDREKIAHPIVSVESEGAGTIGHTDQTALIIVQILGLVCLNGIRPIYDKAKETQDDQDFRSES